jgi:hypothetical protein
MVMWDGRTFEVTLSTLGDSLTGSEPFRFQFVAVPEEGMETFFYKIVPEDPEDANPFEGCGFIPQTGRKLTKYIPVEERLDPDAEGYVDGLQRLTDTIIGDKIAEDPCSYERLVGFVRTETQPFNPVIIYQVEHTHLDDNKLMLLVQANLIDTSPHGTIVVIG